MKVEDIYAKVANTPAVAGNVSYQESELQQMKAIIESSSIRAVTELKKTSKRDSGTMEQVVCKVEESYSRALKSTQARE